MVLLIGRTVLRRPLLSVPTKSAYFCTRAGFATIATAPLVAVSAYYDRLLNASILRYGGITPPKYKFWQNSQGFTADDAMIVGGIGGLLLSFRLRGLQSLSFGYRQFGRLGAISTGTLIGYVPFQLQSVGSESPFMQKSRYERAIAYRKLNDDPKFNESLPPKFAKPIWKRTARYEYDALKYDSLTEDQKAVLCPTMVYSWLDVRSYDMLCEADVAIPVQWQYPESASPAEKRDHMLKEIQFVAAKIRPHSHYMRRVLQGEADLRQRSEVLSQEHGILNMLLFSMILGLPATEEGKRQRRTTLHDWLSVIDADKGENHVPVETLEYLRRAKEVHAEMNLHEYNAAVDRLIQDFERSANKHN